MASRAPNPPLLPRQVPQALAPHRQCLSSWLHHCGSGTKGGGARAAGIEIALSRRVNVDNAVAPSLRHQLGRASLDLISESFKYVSIEVAPKRSRCLLAPFGQFKQRCGAHVRSPLRYCHRRLDCQCCSASHAASHASLAATLAAPPAAASSATGNSPLDTLRAISMQLRTRLSSVYFAS